jgi:heavy metal sensor kinase
VNSIRLSLLLCFLVLLGVALGAVSMFAYRNTEQVLEAKEEARRQLLLAQYETNWRREAQKLDRTLRFQAQLLATQAELLFRFQANQAEPILSCIRYVAPLSLLGVGADANGYLLAPIWFAERNSWPWSEYFRRRRVAEIHFDEDVISRYAADQVIEYFQINGQEGGEWRSRSMGTRAFPFSQDFAARIKPHELRFDDARLEPGVAVRRVTLKVPVTRYLVYPPQRPPRSEGGRPASMTRAPNAPFRRMEVETRPITSPEIVIQCAAETKIRDSAIAWLKSRLDSDLAGLREESAATLKNLRNWLLFIGLTTFATTFVGGLVLIRMGLSPLRRLSEAVSRVSAKDFQLRLDGEQLPSELHPIVDRLTQTLELLKGSFAREKQAAADISHELRTPLAALLTTIEVGLRKTRSVEDYQALLNDCHAIGQQMSRLVERLLALARLDAGVDRLRPCQVEVTALAEQCASIVRPLAEARDLTLRVIRNGPIELRTDPDKFSEILTNLLHNAIEYNKPKGTVEMTVERQNGRVLLTVRDTGIGISTAARRHIFERFYRADPSRQADGLHAGLGLAIVKGYVDLMGGQIHVASVEGQGSTFQLSFPVGDGHSAADTNQAAPSAARR